MAGSINVEVLGVKELYGKLAQIKSTVAADQVMGKATEIVRATAVNLCPVDTGHLRSSIHARVEHAAGGTVGIVYNAVEYAPYVEYGTGIHSTNKSMSTWTGSPAHRIKTKAGWRTVHGTRPYPFMRPALRQNRNKIVRLFQSEIDAAVKGK